MKKGRVGIWGDSIVCGWNDIQKFGWVNRLKEYVNEELPEDVSIFNFGIAGDTTDKLISRFESECKAKEPEVIIFAIGINDTKYIKDSLHPKVTIEKFKKNLLKLIDTSHKYSTKIGFIGLTIVDESKTIPWITGKNYSNTNIRKYDLELENISKLHKINYLKMSDKLQVEDLDDGLHPNSQGHEKIYEKTKEFILNMLS